MSVIALILLASPVGPQVALPVPDVVLAEQRGGFRLPGGIDVAMTVQSVTSVNGVVVLGTTFRADQGTPTTTVYAPKPGEPVASHPANAWTSGGTTPPTVTYDPKTGVLITPGASMPRVSISTAPNGAASSTDGLAQVAADQPYVTDNGTVTQSQRGGLGSVTLQGQDLSITHFSGNAFGSAIENSGSDRAIDTQTVISLDIRNAGPDVLGSAMLRAGNIATDAIALRGQ